MCHEGSKQKEEIHDLVILAQYAQCPEFQIQYRLKKSILRQPANIAQFDKSRNSSLKHTAS